MDYERAKQIAENVFYSIVFNLSPSDPSPQTRSEVITKITRVLLEEFAEKPAVVKPIPGWIFVEEFKPQESVSDGGLFLPANNTDQDLARAKVLAVNDVIMKGGKVRPCLVKPGQVVMYEKFRGNDVQIGEHHYVLVEEKHLLAVEDNHGCEESTGQAGQSGEEACPQG